MAHELCEANEVLNCSLVVEEGQIADGNVMYAFLFSFIDDFYFSFFNTINTCKMLRQRKQNGMEAVFKIPKKTCRYMEYPHFRDQTRLLVISE
jgi:hypothetical protein